MRALVTGACGFVGGYLCRHLLDCGDEVLGTVVPLAALPPGYKRPSYPFETLELDITSAENCARVISSFKPDVIYHLAGIAFVPEAEEHFEKALCVNVGGTSNIYRIGHALGSGIRIVLVSSAEVYGKISPGELPITESTPVRPANNYSLSKLMAEFVAERYGRLGNVTTVIARPFNHIGAGQNDRFVASSFARQLAQIKKGKIEPVIRVGNLEAKRDFSDVRDIVRAYRLAAEKGSGTYNFGSGRSVSIRYILDTLISIAGLDVKIEVDPERMRPSDQPDVYGSFARAKSDLGWEPRFDLRSSLEEIYAWWHLNA